MEILGFLGGLAVFVFVVMLLFKQVKTAIQLNSWASRLRKRNAAQDEAEHVIYFLYKAWYIPNHPKYWGACKTIYFSVLHSRDVDFETKTDLFDRLVKLKCHGLVRPLEKYNRHG